MSKKEEIIEEITQDTDTSEESEKAPKKYRAPKDEKADKALKAELDGAKKQLEEKSAQYDELNDKYMRVLAEYDNFRRRSQKERDGIYSDAYSDAVKYILPIYDNLERAVQYADSDSMKEGMDLLMKSFTDALSKMGITEIEALGKPFDPELHNAVMHIEDESYGENEVIEVLQKGFIRDGKVVRYSMVKVAN